MDENKIIEERKKKLFSFFKKNYGWISYTVLAILVWSAVKIRTSNLAGLKDITTGEWTLGPDLDPFLFLRWTKHIVEHGSLMAHDFMRYVPLGFNTAQELALHSYMMAWFHKIALIFGSQSVTYSVVIYPAFMFGLAMVTFFLMVRKTFSKAFGEMQANLIALVATFFLSVMPVLLPRTIAGIPEKEAGALPFMFLAFYFFIVAWDSRQKYSMYLFAILAGLSTGIMGLIWGGHIYIYATIALAGFISFILGMADKHKATIYGLWLISGIGTVLSFSERFRLTDLMGSVFTGGAILVFGFMIVDLVLFKTKFRNNLNKTFLRKLPHFIVSAITTIVLAIILASFIFGPTFIFGKVLEVKNVLVTPVTDRLGITVAENKQPYFKEWESSFGPHIKEIALTFWLFFFGAVYLFFFTIKEFEKERIKLSLVFAFFLWCLVFSRYTESGMLNGTNTISLLIYALGPIALILYFGYYYYKYYKTEEGLVKFKSINFGLILILAYFVISIISARSAVRLIMMLVPPAAIMVGYISIVPAFKASKVKDSFWKMIYLGIVAIIIIATVFSGYAYYNAIKSSAPSHIPSIYTQQWQKAMAWVRAETPKDAVFGHWWDYGYWLQSIGERATVLDGGNAIPYWNHMMGRYALTGTNETEALEFLYAHNTTHFLIDSTDIGKYGAFSSIGSDVNYDRASFIPAFPRDDSQIQERKNSTVYLYRGGAGLDSDVIYDDNGTRLFLPAGQAGIGAVLVEKNKEDEVISLSGIFVYQNKQYNLPLRYVYDGEFRDFGFGVESGVFLMPRADQTGNSLNIVQDGALLYLSKRTVKSRLAWHYLYKIDTEHFKLLHSEDDFLVASVKAQGGLIENDIIFFQGVRGPIRIWEIIYPENMTINKKYIETKYPAELMRV